MKNVVKILAAFAVVAMIAPQAAEAHSRHNRVQVNCNQVNCQAYQPVVGPSPYPHGQLVYGPSGYSWVDGAVGSDGYPAWMGGARPR
ncbi:MAG TPA: hypothetical protein V6C81_31015 [Planktothrix sp.]|jgi:hypothetical protein